MPSVKEWELLVRDELWQIRNKRHQIAKQTALVRYGLTALGVTSAYFYCSAMDWAVGYPTTFLLVVAFALRFGGPGPAWFGLVASSVTFALFSGQAGTMRMVWNSVFLLTPFIFAPTGPSSPVRIYKRIKVVLAHRKALPSSLDEQRV